MARAWVHILQTHSPISRKICVPTSFAERILASSRDVCCDITAVASRVSLESGCSCSHSGGGRAAMEVAVAKRNRRMEQHNMRLFSPGAGTGAAGGAGFPFHRHSSAGQLLMPAFVCGGGQRPRISTVASRGTAGKEAGIESGAAAKDREILVQHILLKEDQVQLLIELQRKIAQEGLDLSDLAEEYSSCPSKQRGGMIGWIKAGQTDPAFEAAAFNAPINKLVRAKTKHGLHLLQVLNERKAQFLQQIQVEQFYERMQDPTFLEEAQLIDVREPNEISTAAIEGFEAYPLSQFGNWAPDIADDLDPEKDTYVLCHHGMRSMQAASWLQSQGFSRLYNIVGGIHAFSTRVDRSIPTY